MESLYKLPHAQKFKVVNVSHDMTKSEREECKRLVNDAKATSEQDGSSGEFLYRVQGNPGQMRVVKIKVRN